MACSKSQLKIMRIFKKVKISKVIVYKNPNECSSFKIERVNPDHVGIVWGLRKRTGAWTKIGKVYFSILPVALGLSVVAWLDALTFYAFGLLLQVGVFGLIVGFIVYLPLLLEVYKCSIGSSAFSYSR